MGHINSIGQEIEIGDRVVYIGWQWSRTTGTFLGVSPKECVRIESDKLKNRAIKNIYRRKTHRYNDANCWLRQPGDFYIHNESGLLLDRDDYRKLSYPLTQWQLKSRGLTEQPAGVNERANYRYDTEGKLRDGFYVIETPYVYVGVKGLKRTFKLADGAE